MSTELVSTFSTEEARTLTDEMRADYNSLQARLITAFEGRIWLALGHESWQDYINVEFQDISLRPPKELEEKVIRELRDAGMSTRGIAAATEMGKSTINRHLQDFAARESTVPNGTDQTRNNNPNDGSARIIGLDGRERPATRPTTPARPTTPPESHIIDAEIIEDHTAPADERSAADLGLTPTPVDMTGRPGLNDIQSAKLMADLHASGSAPLVQVRARSRDVIAAFEAGQVNLDEGDRECVEDLGWQAADTLQILSDLINEIARFHHAWDDDEQLRDTIGSITKATNNLKMAANYLAKEIA